MSQYRRNRYRSQTHLPPKNYVILSFGLALLCSASQLPAADWLGPRTLCDSIFGVGGGLRRQLFTEAPARNIKILKPLLDRISWKIPQPQP